MVTQKCGGCKNFTFTRHKFLLVTVKEWLKLVLNCGSYPKNKTGYPFFGPPCIGFWYAKSILVTTSYVQPGMLTRPDYGENENENENSRIVKFYV